MDFIVDIGVLANSAFEGAPDYFADQLYSHPPLIPVVSVESLWRSVRTNFADDSVEIMVTLRYSYEATYLTSSIALSRNNGDSGRDSWRESNTDCGTRNRSDVT